LCLTRGQEPKQLYYYRQHEWRVVRGIQIKGESLERELSAGEKNTLLDIDKRFFCGAIKKGMFDYRRIDHCTVIPAVPDEQGGEKPVHSFVNRIIVPKAALGEAKKLAKEYGCESKVLDFESALDSAERDTLYEAALLNKHSGLLQAAKKLYTEGETK
jgi:hypothetical protein